MLVLAGPHLFVQSSQVQARLLAQAKLLIYCRFRSFETAQYGPYTALFCTTSNSGLVCFHYNKKHKAVECIVVLWAKIVVEFMLLWSGLQSALQKQILPQL